MYPSRVPEALLVASRAVNPVAVSQIAARITFFRRLTQLLDNC